MRNDTVPTAAWHAADRHGGHGAIRRPGPGVRWLLAALLAVGGAAVQISAQAQAQAQAPDQERPAGHGMRHGPGPGMGPGGGGMGMMFGGSPERMARGVDRLLDGVGATDAQRTQIKQIVLVAAAELKTHREATAGLRQQSMQVFTAPVVDADAAESLRRQVLSQHDQASKRMLQAMLDVAKVLTAEQRSTLGQRMQRRATMLRGHSGPQRAEPAVPGAPAVPQKQ
jgi:periplasmic protein CpxP/Spy